jgi:hypothetical protein
MLRISSQLSCQSALRAGKIKTCNTLTRPVATYEEEHWTLNKDITKRLPVFGGRALRRIFGRINAN